LARDIVVAAGAPADEVGDDALPMRRSRSIHIGPVPVDAARISYAGELGWELTTPIEWAVAVWDRLLASGAGGLEPFGYRALDALRMEKGYRYFGTDLTMLDTPYEAGLGAFVRLEKGPFVGREALVTADATGSDRRLRTLLIGGPDYEPIYGGEAVRLEGEVIGRLRSVAYGPTVERTIGYSYLTAALARGADLEIDVFDRRVAAVIAPDVVVDPRGDRMRG
jgi:glycine cleavage system aminomethyltransferase T